MHFLRIVASFILDWLHVLMPLYILCSGGRQEDVHFDKITSRIQKLCYGLNLDFVDPVCIAEHFAKVLTLNWHFLCRLQLRWK